jgi:hypothetical protein
MAQKVTQYRSDSGKSFDNEHDAWRDDVLSWFQTVGMNEGVARQLLDSLDTDTGCEAFGTMLGGLHRTRNPLPEPPARDHFLFLPGEPEQRRLRPVK